MKNLRINLFFFSILFSINFCFGQKRIYGVKNNGGIGNGCLFTMNDTGGEYKEIKVFKYNLDNIPNTYYLRKNGEILSYIYENNLWRIIKFDSNKMEFNIIGSINYSSKIQGISKNGKYLFGFSGYAGKYNKGYVFRYDIDSNKEEIIYNFYDTFEYSIPQFTNLQDDSVLFGSIIYGSKFGTHPYAGCFYTVNLYTGDFNQITYIPKNGNLQKMLASGFVTIDSNWLYLQDKQYLRKYNFKTGNYKEYSYADSSKFGSGPLRMTKHSNGNFYWPMSKWGPNRIGTIIEYNTILDSLLVYANFNSDSFNTQPATSLLEASDHNLYGYSNSGHTFYKFEVPTNTISIISHLNQKTTGEYISFADGMNFRDNFFIAITYGMGSTGKLISFNPFNKNLKLWYHFRYLDHGSNPTGNLVLAGDGYLYGTCRNGGLNNNGTIFKIHPITLAFKKVGDFDSMFYIQPKGDLCLNSNGRIYDISTKIQTSSYKNVIYEFNVVNQSFGKYYTYSDDMINLGPINNLENNKIMFWGYQNFKGNLVSLDLSTGTQSILKSDLFTSSSLQPFYYLTPIGNGNFYGYSNHNFYPTDYFGFYSFNYSSLTAKREVSFVISDSIEYTESNIAFADSVLYTRCYSYIGSDILSYNLRTKQLKRLGLTSKLERSTDGNKTIATENGYLFGISNSVAGQVWKYNLKTSEFSACATNAPNYGTVNNSGLTFLDPLDLTARYKNSNLVENLSIYPNPCNGTMNVRTNEFLQYAIFDINGKIIQKGVVDHTNAQINLNQAKSGFYFIQFTNANKENNTLKILKY